MPIKRNPLNFHSRCTSSDVFLRVAAGVGRFGMSGLANHWVVDHNEEPRLALIAAVGSNSPTK